MNPPSANSTLPKPPDLILVCIMKSPRDLEIARVLGWYRIPIRSAPKVIAVDYLAFYQTAAFGKDKWCIRYLAPVRGHELVKRAELLRDEADHPHADQEYYKIQLGPLITLSNPILATKWRRITFFYTTGELLLQAETIKDLLVPEEERKTLWQSLRERAQKSQRYGSQADSHIEMDLPPEVLASVLGVQEAERIFKRTNHNSDL